MVYNPHPPYEILQNKLLDFATMQRLRRFARYWDLVGNSGNFLETTPLIWSKVKQASSLSPKNNEAGKMPVPLSPFHAFLRWSDWLHARVKRTDSIALMRLMELLFEFLTAELRLDPKLVAETMWRDYQRGGRFDKPGFMKIFCTQVNRIHLATPNPLCRNARRGIWFDAGILEQNSRSNKKARRVCGGLR